MNVKDLVRSIFKIPTFEKILLKKVEGKRYNETKWCKFIPNNYSYKKHKFRQIEREGIKYELDLSELIDWHIYFGIKEDAKYHFFNLIQKGSVVIDVGANIGDMTLNFSKRVGKEGAVYSFEPFLASFRKLTKHIEINGCENVHLFNLGLGDKPGKFLLEERTDNNSGMNRIAIGTDKNTHEIQIATLDQFILAENISEINFLKIDVEGFEKKVLLGANDVLQNQKPALFIELDDNYLKDQGDSSKELIQLLESYNYKITIATTNETITSSYNFTNKHFDIICK